jgi:hypothetical protein
MADAKPEYKLYLFKGKQYLKVDPTTMRIEGGPSSVSNWNGLAAALNGGAAIDGIDAAVYLPAGASQYPGTVMFFKADKYCIFDTQKEAVTASGKIADLLRNLPTDDTKADFTSDVDAAMIDGASNLHLFKGGYNAYAPVDSLDFNHASRSVSAWSPLHPYAAGIQAATDWYFFRGDSWTTYETGRSETIEAMVPGVQELDFGYELNDVLLAPFDKKEPVTSYHFMAPARASLTVLVLNNLSAQTNVTVTVDGTATPDLQVPAQRVWYNIYASNSGHLGIDVSDDRGTPMLLSTSSSQIGHGTYLYIGAEKEPAGIYTDTIVMISWPSKVV